MSAVPAPHDPTRRRPGRVWLERRAQTRQVVQHSATPEPRSLTDARARVDGRLVPPVPERTRLRGLSLGLLVADVVAVAVALAVVPLPVLAKPVFAAAALLARGAMRHYRPRLHLSVLDELPRTLLSVFAIMGALLIATSLTGERLGDGRDLCRIGLVFAGVSLLLHTVVLHGAKAVRRRRGAQQRTLIIGAGRVGVRLAQTMIDHPELGLLPVGFTDPDSLTLPADLPLPVVSTDLEALARTVTETGATTVVMAFSAARESQIVDAVITAHSAGCAVLVVPRMFELHHDGPDVERVRGIPLIRLRPDPTLRPTWWVKRAVDVVGALLALLLLSPVLISIAVAVLVLTGRPLLFWQERVGLDGQPFWLCKFRSLQPVTEQQSQTTWNVADDPSMTAVGRLLRRTSLDELPQLLNIVRGEMSFVGPRPERPGFVQQFTSEHERYWARHRVPVGLTGLAQVNGLRGNTSIRERARYDNYYIANWSLWLDARIALLTVREVVSGGGR
jgi:exopolysaccharide biosynthesis polyprenyl glycosylphosphotransferase